MKLVDAETTIRPDLLKKQRDLLFEFAEYKDLNDDQCEMLDGLINLLDHLLDQCEDQN